MVDAEDQDFKVVKANMPFDSRAVVHEVHICCRIRTFLKLLNSYMSILTKKTIFTLIKSEL